MNWNKAVNILIILFVVVNSILGIANYKKNISAYQLSQRRIDNVVKVLGEEHITIPKKLPKYFRPKVSLWTEPDEVTGQLRDELVEALFGDQKKDVMISQIESTKPYGTSYRVYALGDRSLTFGGRSISYRDESIILRDGQITQGEAEKSAKMLLKQLNLMKQFKNAKIEYRSESYGALITYYEVYEGLPLFDSFVTLQVTPQGVASLYMQSVNVVTSSSELKPLYPIDKVLYGLQDEEVFQNPVVIEEITLGYGMKNSEGMHILKEEAIPIYKVQLEGLDTSVFVNAYTNTVEPRGISHFYK